MTEEMQHSTETQSVATRQTDQTANIAPEVAKAKEGKREKCRPMTKIVIRRLPATMTQEQFLEQVSPLSEYDYMYFARADMSLGQYAFSRAYIDFVDPQDVFGFREKFDNYVFVDSKGTEFPAVVEYAPFQRVPKKRIGKKKDIKCATIESDPYYVNFLEGLKSQDTEAGNGQPKTEYSFQLVDHAAKKVTSTPLLDFLKQRKQEKQRLRDEKREEKRKRDLERKRSKDEPMISQVLKNVQDQDNNSRHVNKENKDDKERFAARDLKNKNKKEDGWYSRDQKGKQVQVPRKNYRDGDDRVAVVQDREAKPSKKHKDENYRKKHDRDLQTKQDQSNEKNEIASCKERKLDEKRGKSYEKMRQEKKKLVEIRNKQDDDLDSLDDNGDEQDRESRKANENKSKNEQQDGKTSSRVTRKSSQMSDVTREEEHNSTTDMLEEVCERLSQADMIEEKLCENPSKPSPIKSLVKRRSSLESGADKNSASGSKTSTSSGSSNKKATECLRRHKSLDGDDDDSNLQKSESNEKDKDKKTDPRVERRIRNKDRPAMEIYRPGMGKFSKKRMGQEKGEGSDDPVVTRSPSPSSALPSSSAKPGKDSGSQVRTMTFKRSASREVPYSLSLLLDCVRVKVQKLRRLGIVSHHRYSSILGNATTEHRIVEVGPNHEPFESPFPRNKITTCKYSLWNFIPKNLMEQFRRVGNLYFLSTVIAAWIAESLVAAWTTGFPLLLVILVTACKQGYENILRYRVDCRVNDLPVTVIRQKRAQKIPCQQIVVGDIVRVNGNEQVPCDLVILQSSEPSGKCYVTTSNLDGESNLKTLQVPSVLLNLDIAQVISMRATITCQHPVADLYVFEGKLRATIPAADSQERLEGSFVCTAPLAIENVALRGARLKNVDHVIGCAVYTGKDTKLSLNSNVSIGKFSTAEKSTNKYILLLMFILAAEVFFCSAMKVASGRRVDSKDAHLSSDPDRQTSAYANLFNDVLVFLGLLNYLVPISLYVTIEMQNFLGAFLFRWDLEMYDELTDQPAIANTSDLDEDLGQIEYLFSDKTGTLTENKMIFRRCFSDDGNAYLEKDCDGRLYILPPDGTETRAQKIHSWSPQLWHLMLSVSLCHSVRVAPPIEKTRTELTRVQFRASLRSRRPARLDSALMMDPDLPEYQASSADEKSLVEAAARCGVIFLGENDRNEMEIDARGSCLSFERLDILEFTSDRKRMSVIVKDQAGDVWLYCKGADSSMFPLLERGKLRAARSQVHDFSTRGLRTLVVGFKKLTDEQYQGLGRELNRARQTIGRDRVQNVESAYYNLENGLTLLGVTALEDRLQENVPTTIEKLGAAGIKVWVLTGDKVETAENIAFYCGLFKERTRILRLVNEDSHPSCYVLLTNLERKLKMNPFTQHGLVMDGRSAAAALRTCPSLLRSVAMACHAVVCCRMSPLQKSEIVHLVKRAASRPLTAAIGDGGNDVSMIQEAHIGLGITGQEGRQAAMSADYAFAKFAHLERALLVHGHWYYVRTAVLVQYFFYKNIVLITPQLLFNVYGDFFGKALYDRILSTLFNIVFTSVPILVYGMLEQNCSDNVLSSCPQLYQSNRRNHLLSCGQFVLWTLMALWQTCAVYFIPFYCYELDTAVLLDSTSGEHWCFGTCVFHLVTLAVNLQILLMSCYWTIPFALAVCLSQVAFFVVTFVYACFSWGITNDHLHDVFSELFLSYDFWLLTLLIAVVCLMPTLLFVVHKNTRFDALRVANSETRREDFIGAAYTRTAATSLTVASDDGHARLVRSSDRRETTSPTTMRRGCF